MTDDLIMQSAEEILKVVCARPVRINHVTPILLGFCGRLRRHVAVAVAVAGVSGGTKSMNDSVTFVGLQ